MHAERELPGPGSVVARRYRVVALLGRGGMGAVLEALDTVTSRAVALKWMLPRAADDASAVSRFLLEARAAARIEHPNVIGVIDAGVDGGSPYLVMERLRGESLAERLRRGRLGAREALELLVPACRGVAEAHREGVIHRDLKPENIFLCESTDGAPPLAKILDFGIAKLYEPDGDVPLTKSRVALGTPRYMSPQQLGAPREVDPRFDVYAMGVVLYQSLTGRLPYDGAGMLELVSRIAGGNPTPLRALAPEVPPALELTVLRAMHVRAEVRHASMEELARELEVIRASLTGEGPEPLAPAAAAIASVASAPSPLSLTVPEDGATPLAYRPPALPAAAASSPARSDPPRPAARARRAPPRAAPKRSALLLGALATSVVLLCVAAVLLGVAAWNRRRPSGREPVVAAGVRSDHADVELAFGGPCRPRFDEGTVVVAHTGPGQLAISSQTGARVHAAIVIDAQGAALPGRIPLTEETYVRTGLTVTVSDAARLPWGSARGSAATGAWPIRGALIVERWDPERGIADVTFEGVLLENVATASLCAVEGRLVTHGLTGDASLTF